MMTCRTLLIRTFALWCVIALVACGGRRPSTPPDSGQRIVSLVPSITEMLFAMGAGPEVVGVSSFDRFPEDVADLPKVGALIDPDFEHILTLNPTLVVVYHSQEELVARLARASVPTYTYQHAVGDSLADIPRTIRAMGERIGHAAGADRVATGIERDLAAIRTDVGGRRRPATALVFGREPGTLRGIYVSGGVGFLHELLETAGGHNVFGDVPRESLQASTEIMLARRPEVIVELRTTPMADAQLEVERNVWSRLGAIPAVRDNRVRILTDPALSIPGPRLVRAARALAAAVE